MTEQNLRSAQRYYARRELGLCVRCGGYIADSDRYVTCDTCREKVRINQSSREKTEWRREYMRQYRAKEKHAIKTIAEKVIRLMDMTAGDLKSDRQSVASDHKCWSCEWSKFHGDRFFCPLVGCVKDGGKNENKRT